MPHGVPPLKAELKLSSLICRAENALTVLKDPPLSL